MTEALLGFGAVFLLALLRVPLAFAITEGSEVRAPMGQAVIGGVITIGVLATTAFFRSDAGSLSTLLARMADILAEALATAPGDLELGIGRYHSPTEARARSYGRTVLTIWQGLRRLPPGAGS